MIRSKLLRLGGSGTAVFRSALLPDLKRKASNSLSAVQDTYLSTKEIFERHKVVFTISTSIASVLTAWAGYSIRHYHEKNITKRLESIEEAMKTNYDIERREIKKIVTSGNVSSAACLATAGTTLVIGYLLGWRGGAWYANRKSRREQMKLLGQMKPNRWRLMKKSLLRSRLFESARKPKESANSLSGSVSATPTKAEGAGNGAFYIHHS